MDNAPSQEAPNYDHGFHAPGFVVAPPSPRPTQGQTSPSDVDMLHAVWEVALKPENEQGCVVDLDEASVSQPSQGSPNYDHGFHAPPQAVPQERHGPSNIYDYGLRVSPLGEQQEHASAAPQTKKVQTTLTVFAGLQNKRKAWTDDDVTSVLQGVFDHSAFRDHQLQAILALLEGRDGIAAMPTGSGKSLCYQVPAVVANALVVVITPLVVLMEDQVARLRSKKVPAAHLSAAIGRRERNAIFAQVAAGSLRCLYISPELLLSSRTRDNGAWAAVLSAHKAGHLLAFAVDEGHEIFECGGDIDLCTGSSDCCEKLFQAYPFEHSLLPFHLLFAKMSIRSCTGETTACW